MFSTTDAVSVPKPSAGAKPASTVGEVVTTGALTATVCVLERSRSWNVNEPASLSTALELASTTAPS